MQAHRIALAAVCAATLVVPATAAATAVKSHAPKAHARCRTGYRLQAVMVKKRVRRHGRLVVVKRHGNAVMVKQRRRGRVVMHCVKQHPRHEATSKPAVQPDRVPNPSVPPRAAAAQQNASQPLPPVTGTGGVDGTDCATAPVGPVRVILFDSEALDRFLGCARNAVASGHPLMVTIDYDPSWSIAQDVARVQQALVMYGPLNPFEVSIGNEQELDKEPADHYARVWDVTEPLVARELPNALRGAGEISPWGYGWLVNVVNIGLPGAQLLAGHVYPDAGHGFWPGYLLKLAADHGMEAMATEGECGQSSWMQYGCRPASDLTGYALAVDWVG